MGFEEWPRASKSLKATINIAIIGSGIYHSRSLRAWRVKKAKMKTWEALSALAGM
jgi:hypothetical protein